MPRLWPLFCCALSALVIVWLPLALLQELDALLAFAAPAALLRDLALLLPMVAAVAGVLALLARLAGECARLLGRNAAIQSRLAWATLLVSTGWLCAWQITRSVRLWLQTTSGVTLSVGPHTRLVGIAVLILLMLLLWHRFGAARLGRRTIDWLSALRTPSLALVAAAVLATLLWPPQLRTAAAPPAAAAPRNGPDVLLISIDALAAEDAGACGPGPTLMPRLRQLAAGATCFNRFYAGSNFTTPTTSTIETGLLPWSHLSTQIAAKLPAPLRDQTVAARLRDAGYRTHFITDNFLASPLHHGSWRAYDDQRFARSLLRNRMREALTIFPDTTLPLVVDSIVSFVGAFDAYLHADNNPYDSARVYAALPAMLATSEGASFVWAHTMPPHAPYLPPLATRHKLLAAGELEQWHEFLEENVPYGAKAQALVDKHRLRYRESIMAADESLGRLLDELQRLGRMEQTIMIVTADHGESFERNFIGHAGPLLHDAVIRIPLVIKLPGQKLGRVVDQPVSQADLAPTLLDLAGAAPLARADGRSLRPLLEGATLPAVPVYSMSMERQSRFRPLSTGHYAVIDASHKLVWHLGEDSVELYDLQADARERDNLAVRRPELAGRLLAMLRERLRAAEAARPGTIAEP